MLQKGRAGWLDSGPPAGVSDFPWVWFRQTGHWNLTPATCGGAGEVTSPLLASVSPFIRGANVLGFPELVPGRRSAQSLGAPWNGGRGGHPRPHLPVQKPRAICPPPHPAAPPQPRSEGRAKPPPRRPHPRGDSELMRGECSRVGVSKRRARRGGAAGRGGSACPRALSRQRAEAGEAAPGPADPDTSSSGRLPARAGCQARAGGLDPGGRGSQEGGGVGAGAVLGLEPREEGSPKNLQPGWGHLCGSLPLLPRSGADHPLHNY